MPSMTANSNHMSWVFYSLSSIFIKLTRILNGVGFLTNNDSRHAFLLSETTPTGFTTEPASVKNFMLGNNVTFLWTFNFGSMPQTYFEEIIFGETDNDSIKDKYITIHPDLTEVKNPTVVSSLRDRLGVVSKTITATEISVQFQIQNANTDDASPKTYGCQVNFDFEEYRSGPVELAGEFEKKVQHKASIAKYRDELNSKNVLRFQNDHLLVKNCWKAKDNALEFVIGKEDTPFKAVPL